MSRLYADVSDVIQANLKKNANCDLPVNFLNFVVDVIVL